MTSSPARLWEALTRGWPPQQLPPKLPVLTDEFCITSDSRAIKSGDVFVAVPGSARDGREFIEAALSQGAALVLAHADSPSVQLEGQVLHLPHLARRLGEFGRTLFAVPGGLDLIGVTGTNGKSSVTHYIAALSEQLDTPAGVIGTLGTGRLDRLNDSGLTTPGPLALQHALSGLAQSGAHRVALEASSHALDQGRLDGCPISVGVFTNLSRDHLDYHGSMAAYAASKARLFRRSEITLAVVNAADPLTRLMLAGLEKGVRVLAVGEDQACTLRVVGWHPHALGQNALIATPKGEKTLELGLMGRFNLDNVLLAIATLYGLGEPLAALFDAAAKLSPVPGRMALLKEEGAPSVVIDYAHTPDALGAALGALGEHLGDAGKLWCVFGCGGERDTGKRAEMARVAESLADHCVITDDNPRGEPADAIRRMIIEGFSENASFREVGDRRAAIAEVVATAGPQDVVLIAGKGHEPYQEIDGVRHAYRDDLEVQKALAARSVR
ncbi:MULTISPECIES: UDP-N-acetylmuramoyl-L-alanyl-D-glutamate--2,6-diaminopimelate ligase [unclassified Halomonas]|uniref:UDP-N-acetylmuramoyl-L-alanyl-D-glutamate--2, 6-diaminopimelate ligase n=1 Tax=unclassified Halomonas TaxID=2609666 RepID=UPI002076755A|nr:MULTISPECIES: UDP-N-acetylmuramoyl-L-alanyl-D-glutamate--2,6-diaminopimelate ligase [unclassified Halomonas]